MNSPSCGCRGRRPFWGSRLAAPVTTVATIIVAIMYMACVDRQPSRVAEGSAAEPLREPVLSDDRVCEMWIAHSIRELTDLWARRYAVTVWCMSTKESAETAGYHWSGEGEITVTVTLANAQDALSARAEADAEGLLRAQLEGACRRTGWTTRYPRRLLQFVP
jgi:hypothetical protein